MWHSLILFTYTIFIHTYKKSDLPTHEEEGSFEGKKIIIDVALLLVFTYTIITNIYICVSNYKITYINFIHTYKKIDSPTYE